MPCPVTAIDAQAARGDDIGYIAGNKHPTADEQTEQGGALLIYAQSGPDLDCRESSIVDNRRESVEPE